MQIDSEKYTKLGGCFTGIDLQSKFTNLIHVKLDIYKRHSLIGIAVVLEHTIQRFRDILHDKVEE